MYSFIDYLSLAVHVVSAIVLILTYNAVCRLPTDLTSTSIAKIFIPCCFGYTVLLIILEMSFFSNAFSGFLIECEPFYLFYGPFLYALNYTYNYEKSKVVTLRFFRFHFLFAFLFVLLFCIILFLFDSIDQYIIDWFKRLLFAAIALQCLVYGFYLYTMNSISLVSKKSRFIFYILIILYISIGCVYFDAMLFITNNTLIDFVLSLLSFLLFICLYYLFSTTDEIEKPIVVHDEIVEHTPEVVKYAKSTITDEMLAKYKIEVDLHIIEHKRFLLSDYSLEKLAEDTKINKHHISQLFSRVYKSSFTKVINKQRVEFSLEILQKNPTISIADLGIECGFNSRTSFFRAFKEVVGVSPSEYVARLGK